MSATGDVAGRGLIVEPVVMATVTGLTVMAAGPVTLLRGGGLTLRAGRISVITGPSGSGKTTLMRALLGHLPAGATREAGLVDVGGTDPFTLSGPQLQRFRRANLAYVGQDPGAALNPTMRVGTLLAEVAADRDRAALRAVLEQVSLPAHYLRRRPAELSGGEQRRVAIARALGRRVRILLIDEPLAGLDPALRAGIASLLRGLADDHGLAIAVSGHDNSALGALADDVVDRTGDRARSSAAGRPARSRAPADPGRTRAPADAAPVILSAESLAGSVDRGRTRIVHGVDLQVRAGTASALIGASGAGKTTVARILVGLHQSSTGRIELHGTPLHHRAERRSSEQKRRIAWVPQDPLSTLNPSRTIGATLSRPLTRHRVVPTDEREHRIRELLAQVELPPASAARYPHELSGGQRQRVAIARALASEPDVLICDEITSALDAATAGAIMELLAEAQSRRGLGLLLITHQLALVDRHCATVTVLHRGALVEAGPADSVLGDPRHPATVELVTGDPSPKTP
ncbi:ABC transporter ATP-binding protein [Pseudonocardia sp. DLS-67]